MGPHYCVVESEVNARVTNARVPLNVRHPKFGK